jgi:ADP-ribosylglycohydrolase
MVRKKGLSFQEASKAAFGGEGSLGNGAAMRIGKETVSNSKVEGPLGLFCTGKSVEEIWTLAEKTAIPTHSHIVGIDGAFIQALAISKANIQL